ncbi:MAG TPA: hypothetical protein VHN20_07090 [Beijerinckiaceae bacterium]|nr:hypothetical protein [Beijerinckiaceae bacterium]
MSGLFSKGPKTQTTTQVQSVPPYVQQAQETLLNYGSALARPFVSRPAAPNQVAPLSRDQQTAFSMARDVARIAGRQGPTLTRTPQAVAAQLTARDIAAFSNPYEDQVVQTTLGDMQRQHGENLTAARARMAAGGAFGGSRQAIMESQMERNFDDTAARTVADLRRQGFDTAANLGMGNVQLRQQAAMLNPALTLQAAALRNNLANDQQTRRLQAAMNLSGMGGLQQNLAQRQIDVPWTVLERMRSITPGATGGTTTTTQPLNQPSPLQTALSLGVLGLGLL